MDTPSTSSGPSRRAAIVVLLVLPALALFLGTVPTVASTPAGGTVGPSSLEVAWTGPTPPGGAAVTQGPDTCADPGAFCDDFTLTVAVDPDETERLVQAWEEAGIQVPLKVVASPYREVTNPILNYVRNVSTESPRDVVTVYIPEYVVGHWWEQILHNQSALRLKGRLRFTPGVMVTSVPYLLKSSGKAEERYEREEAAGPTRRTYYG